MGAEGRGEMERKEARHGQEGGENPLENARPHLSHAVLSTPPLPRGLHPFVVRAWMGLLLVPGLTSFDPLDARLPRSSPILAPSGNLSWNTTTEILSQVCAASVGSDG